jgi:three-Cys-motif partner protein
MVILSQGKFREILYIDGFAGPGEYIGGEAGSPIIALDTALAYKPPLQAKVHFLFVEKDSDRAGHLKQQIARRKIPDHFNVIVDGETTFEASFNARYSRFVRGGRLIPTFAFIDPFGWTGAPFDIVKKILANPSCEVFVNFMYEEINRFIGHKDQTENFNIFFGSDAWAPFVGLPDPRKRNRSLHDLYLKQLHGDAAAAYVRSFEMSNSRDVTDYFLFYATNNLLGLKKMKEAMWKVDEGGEFRFSDSTDPNQFVLFEKAPRFALLQSQLQAALASGALTIGDIEKHVVVETAFRETHYKPILKAWELDGTIEITNPPPDRRRGTFPDPKLLVRLKS